MRDEERGPRNEEGADPNLRAGGTGPPPRSSFRVPVRPWLLPVAATAVILGVGLQQCSTIGGFLTGRRNSTTVTHSLVVDRVQNVAKLVSVEATVRDVLVYRNTWYGSTKQSLVVVTARLMAGVDLKTGTDVKIDENARRIDIALPHASLLATEITDVNTYDEQRGLWNPFRPEDRDRIFQMARQQLARSAEQMRLTTRAEASAKEMLETMFRVDGWVAEVTFRDVPTIRTRDDE